MSKKTAKSPAKKPANAVSKDAPKRPPRAPKARDDRLPPAGTVLHRTWNKKTYSITVGESDFTWNGKTFTSLSALARAATGAKSINGFLWAGLIKPAAPKGKKAKAARAEAGAPTAKEGGR